jgi:hypothetical protein
MSDDPRLCPHHVQVITDLRHNHLAHTADHELDDVAAALARQCPDCEGGPSDAHR